MAACGTGGPLGPLAHPPSVIASAQNIVRPLGRTRSITFVGLPLPRTTLGPVYFRVNSAQSFCGIGSWSGSCLSMAAYVMLTRPTDRGDRHPMVLRLATLTCVERPESSSSGRQSSTSMALRWCRSRTVGRGGRTRRGSRRACGSSGVRGWERGRRDEGAAGVDVDYAPFRLGTTHDYAIRQAGPSIFV